MKKQLRRQHKKPQDALSNNTRKTLLYLVKEKNYSIYRASKELLINYTTAKALMNKYKLRGTIERINNLKRTMK